MSLPYNGELIQFAKALRTNATKQENRLWHEFLKCYPVRFQRQKVIGPFIADFYCHKAKLIIEIDGSQHYTSQGKAYDTDRDAFFAEYELTVIRFANSDIDHRFSDVCEQIDAIVRKQSDKQKNNELPMLPVGSLPEGAVTK